MENNGEKYGLTFDEVINEDGTRTRTMYGAVRNVFEDGGWKRIEDVRSLKEKGL